MNTCAIPSGLSASQCGGFRMTGPILTHNLKLLGRWNSAWRRITGASRPVAGHELRAAKLKLPFIADVVARVGREEATPK